MKCPKCSLDRPLNDQVCRRCKYVFDEDRFLDLTPPRLEGRGPGQPYMAPSRADFRLTDLLSRSWIPPVASLIPGLGHYLQRRPFAAMIYFLLVAGLLILSVINFTGATGQMLFGFMVSTHAMCILDTTPWGKSPKARKRLLGMAALLIGLMLLYWPLLTLLANTFVSVARPRIDHGEIRVARVDYTTQIIVMTITFVASAAASVWLSKKVSALES
ncbi:MAG TPA: hypothetical protein VE981_23185 [Planctomycetota bacterium]|nr:hypothetical protein [Planctomycetota bacterium]